MTLRSRPQRLLFLLSVLAVLVLTSCGKLRGPADESAVQGGADGGQGEPSSDNADPTQSDAPKGEDSKNTDGSDKDPLAPPPDKCGGSAHDNSAAVVRLKSADMMAKSLRDTLGPGKDINAFNNRENLIELYKSQLGTAQGLAFGDTFADSKTEDLAMTGYMLALNIVAINAARQCYSDRSEELCKCDTPESAAAMLTRALPWRNSCPSDDPLVATFAELCREDSIQALTALISSVAFAMRN